MNRTYTQIMAGVVGHIVGLGVVASLLALVTMGPALGTVLGAVASGQTGGSPLISIAAHLGLSALVWLAVVVLVRRAWKRDEKAKRVVKLQRGTALTEFLIILVPFLLLTSGLSQLAILNTAGLLADVAVFNAARAAWVWEAQEDSPASLVDAKARTAAALSLAPSAPSDFATAEAGAVKDLVAELGGGGGGGGPSAENTSLFYNVAYDTGSFSERITKKVYFAYLATTVRHRLVGTLPGMDDGDPAITLPNGRQVVRVDMRYEMNVVFPWFAYIWGDKKDVAGRSGFYVPINRAHHLPRQQRPIVP